MIEKHIQKLTSCKTISEMAGGNTIQFDNKDNNHENFDFIIPPGFFDVKLPVILIEIPYCEKK